MSFLYTKRRLLPIFSKIFERVICNSQCNHFQSNISSQSDFPPGDSFIAHLLSIKHEIQATFDNSPTADMRGVFLDISKDFYSSYKLMWLKVNYLPYLKIIFIIVNKEWY